MSSKEFSQDEIKSFIEEDFLKLSYLELNDPNYQSTEDYADIRQNIDDNYSLLESSQESVPQIIVPLSLLLNRANFVNDQTSKVENPMLTLKKDLVRIDDNCRCFKEASEVKLLYFLEHFINDQSFSASKESLLKLKYLYLFQMGKKGIDYLDGKLTLDTVEKPIGFDSYEEFQEEKAKFYALCLKNLFKNLNELGNDNVISNREIPLLLSLLAQLKAVLCELTDEQFEKTKIEFSSLENFMVRSSVMEAFNNVRNEYEEMTKGNGRKK